MNMIAILNGITIGAAGGFVAGVSISIYNQIKDWCVFCRDKKTIYTYLSDLIKINSKPQWASVKKIASYTNLPIERVTYVCSKHKKIIMSTGNKDGMWGLKGISREE